MFFSHTFFTIFTTFAARFLAVFTVLGGFWGLQETHVYLHLAQEGVTRQSIGLSQAAATLAGAKWQNVRNHREGPSATRAGLHQCEVALLYDCEIYANFRLTL